MESICNMEYVGGVNVLGGGVELGGVFVVVVNVCGLCGWSH